jgi:hypothetical protein
VLRTRFSTNYFKKDKYKAEKIINRIYDKTVRSHTNKERKHMADLTDAKWTIYLDYNCFEVDIYPKFLEKRNGSKVLMSKDK